MPAESTHKSSGRPESTVVAVQKRGAFDRLSGSRIGGPVTFGAVIWVAFKLTTDIASPFIDWIDQVVTGPVQRWIDAGFGVVSLDGGWLHSLMVDGVLVGVGTVLAFVPILVALYFVLAVLGQSGYLARGAASVEGAARRIGLPGSALLPISLGFGCTVPAVLALRSVERPRDRILAGVLVPFMACAARLPVFMLLASAFFVDHRTLVVFGMYVLGIAVAIVIGAVLGSTVLRAETLLAPGASELSPVRRPNGRAVMSAVRSQTASFVRGAGTVVLTASLVIWALLATPVQGTGSFADTDTGDSAFAAMSRVISPALSPLGLGDWTQTGALVTGLIAKEVTVSALAQGYGTVDDPGPQEAVTLVDDGRTIVGGFFAATRDAALAIPGLIGLDLGVADSSTTSAATAAAIREGFEAGSGGRGAAAGLAFMVVVLLYTPCLVTLAAIRRELGLRWMWTSAIGQLVVAWLIGLVTFRLAVLLGVG